MIYLTIQRIARGVVSIHATNPGMNAHRNGVNEIKIETFSLNGEGKDQSLVSSTSFQLCQVKTGHGSYTNHKHEILKIN